MRAFRKKEVLRHTARAAWRRLAELLTPQEQKTVLFIAGLFLLGAVVRWIRLAQTP